MVIDLHFHPAFYEDICQDAGRLRRRCDEMGYHLMSPAPLTNLDRQNTHAGIDKVVILPQDHSTRCGGDVVLSNEEMVQLRSCGRRPSSPSPASIRTGPTPFRCWSGRSRSKTWPG